MLRPIFAAVFALALLLRPETAVNAAGEAMLTWAESVAPAMFPFMVLMPMLAGPEASAAYERLLGPLMRPLFGLPGSAAPVIAAAMTAGSPAGAIAAAHAVGLTRADRERLTGCVCGPGPAFLVSGIGVAMLGSAADGRILLGSLTAAQLILLIITKRISGGEREAAASVPSQERPIRAAVSAVLTVCGYMMMFQTAAAVAADFLNSEIFEKILLCALDLPSGARAISVAAMERKTKIVLIAAMSGCSGLCIIVQNTSVSGTRLAPVLLMRTVCAALTAAISAAGMYLPEISCGNPPPAIVVSTFCAAIFAVPAWFFLANTFFLNKRNSRKIQRILSKNWKNPQHVVDNVDNKILYNDFQKT